MNEGIMSASISIQLTDSSSCCADGLYTIHAMGYQLATLRWANANGPLPGWTAFAYIPLDAYGNGSFQYVGKRAIPPEVMHVAAEMIASDKTQETVLQPLCVRQPVSLSGGVCFGVMSDLHLTEKCHRIRQAFDAIHDADCVLLAGDLTNDGTPEQFELVKQCIDEELAGIPVLAVTGNHDYPVRPLPQVYQGIDCYYRMQDWLLERARSFGVEYVQDDSGAYGASFRNLDIIGLNAISHWRRFKFPDGMQMKWMERYLKQCTGDYHIVLCHAPLHSYAPINPKSAPFLSLDNRLQKIIDNNRSVLFLSGHTHISMNDLHGCVELDKERSNLYINDGSVVKTTVRIIEPQIENEWLHGSVLALSLFNHTVEVVGQSILTGRKMARSYYRFEYSE